MESDAILFWTKIAAIGQVAGALATAAAVITSLWVVLSERRPRLRVTADMRLIIPGFGTAASDAICITIANTGMRRVRCVSIGWRTGYYRRGPNWLRRQQALQNPDYLPGSAQLPFDLDLGDERTIVLAVESHQAAMDADKRTAFFMRKPPWSKQAVPTAIDVIVSVAAHKGVFKRVEPDLAHFLASGEVLKGAADFNAEVENSAA